MSKKQDRYLYFKPLKDIQKVTIGGKGMKLRRAAVYEFDSHNCTLRARNFFTGAFEDDKVQMIDGEVTKLFNMVGHNQLKQLDEFTPTMKL